MGDIELKADEVLDVQGLCCPMPVVKSKKAIDALAAKVYGAITAYSQAQFVGVCYDGAAYPYWFIDDGKGGGTANNGICDGTESSSRDFGAKFDAKGAKAAFNYKWSQAEPGAYLHNYAYMAEILWDTYFDLTGTIPSGTDIPGTRP